MGVTGPSRCPSCDEPLDVGDNFCGRCGVGLVPAAVPPDGNPTISLRGAAVGPAVGPAAYGPPAPTGPPAPPAPPGVAAPPGLPGPAGPFGAVGPVGPVGAVGPVAVPAVPAPAGDPRIAGYRTTPDAASVETAGTATAATTADTATAATTAGSTTAAGTTGTTAAVTTGPGRALESAVPETAESAVATTGVAPEAGPPSSPVAAAPEPRHTPAPGTPGTPEAPATPSTPATPATTGTPGTPDTPSAPLCTACRTGSVAADGYCEHCGHAQRHQRDHMESELAGVAAVSDRGHRHHRNEDYFAVSVTALPDGTPAVIAVVCDGVSSATRPDEASQAASEAAGAALLASVPRGTHPQQAMHEAIIAASAAVNALAAEPARTEQHDRYRQQNAPACTFVGAVVGGGLLTVGWVGDSRAYWVPDDRSAPAARLTEDDSWAAQMVANDLMSEAEAYADVRAHAITGWLGADAYEVEPHTASFKPDGPGVVLVCTDGLWNYAETADRMAGVLPRDAPSRPLHSARTLVAHALDGGGHDNITVAVVPFPAQPGRTGPA